MDIERKIKVLEKAKNQLYFKPYNLGYALRNAFSQQELKEHYSTESENGTPIYGVVFGDAFLKKTYADYPFNKKGAKQRVSIIDEMILELKSISEQPTTWTCRCCESEYQDDFRCISSKNVCMNCCSCAFGMSKPDIENKVCTPIQLKDIGTFKNDNDDLPF